MSVRENPPTANTHDNLANVNKDNTFANVKSFPGAPPHTFKFEIQYWHSVPGDPPLRSLRLLSY